MRWNTTADRILKELRPFRNHMVIQHRFHVAFEQHFWMKTQAITGKNTELISKFYRDLCVCCLTGTLHRNNRLECYSNDRKRRLPHHKQKTLTGIAMNKKYQKSDLKKTTAQTCIFSWFMICSCRSLKSKWYFSAHGLPFTCMVKRDVKKNVSPPK